jgi:hypothetical protein
MFRVLSFLRSSSKQTESKLLCTVNIAHFQKLDFLSVISTFIILLLYNTKCAFDERKSGIPIRGRLHGAFSMCVFMSGEPFDAEACDIGGQASATNGTL